jgi:hypothetical protein
MPRQVSIGHALYCILTSERQGQWVAHAERDDTGDRYGIERYADSEESAAASLIRWLEWQGEHEAALHALQAAEHRYHRTLASSAFVNPTEGPSALELQKESLAAVEAARIRLEEVRARKPD